MSGLARRLSRLSHRLPFLRPIVVTLRAGYTLTRLRGHSRRTGDGLPLDAAGEPIPWFTYACIDVLERLDLAHARVFEFGVGASILWFAKRAACVCGVEIDAAWRARIAPFGDVVLCPDVGGYPERINAFEGVFTYRRIGEAANA